MERRALLFYAKLRKFFGVLHTGTDGRGGRGRPNDVVAGRTTDGGDGRDNGLRDNKVGRRDVDEESREGVTRVRDTAGAMTVAANARQRWRRRKKRQRSAAALPASPSPRSTKTATAVGGLLDVGRRDDDIGRRGDGVHDVEHRR